MLQWEVKKKVAYFISLRSFCNEKYVLVRVSVVAHVTYCLQREKHLIKNWNLAFWWFCGMT